MHKIKPGDKLGVKIGKKFVKFSVISYDAMDGWIKFKGDGKEIGDFTLNTTIHQHHIKIPEPKVEVPVVKLKKPKKTVKKKQPLKSRIKNETSK